MLLRQRTWHGKPLLALDLDGTLKREALLKLVVYALHDRGHLSPGAWAEFDAAYLAYRDRLIDHHTHDRTIVELYRRHIAGIRVCDLLAVAKDVARDHHLHTYLFAKTLLEMLRPSHECIAISGTIREVAEEFGRMHRLDAVIATVMEVTDGVYTGVETHCPAYDKNADLECYCAEHGVSLEESVAAGDTASDARMLVRVRYPLAVNPAPALSDIAEQHGWPQIWERKEQFLVVGPDSHRRFTRDTAKEGVRHALALAKAATEGKRP